MIRVLIVDDQSLIRAGVARILSVEDDVEVVGECTDGSDVVAAVERLRPDLVLMDIRMPRVDGTAATRALRAAHPIAPAVLVLTTFDDDDALWSSLDAGANGFILKDSEADEMVAAVRAVAGGASWLDAKVAPRVLSALRGGGRGADGEARIEELSEREHDVLRLMASGSTNAEIAGALHVSPATVKTHVGSIFAKLGARDRAAAIVIAFDRGIATPRRWSGSDGSGPG